MCSSLSLCGVLQLAQGDEDEKFQCRCRPNTIERKEHEKTSEKKACKGKERKAETADANPPTRKAAAAAVAMGVG